MSKVHTPKTTISPNLLGWSIGPGVRHAHPDPKHGFAENRLAWVGVHLMHEHGYAGKAPPFKTLEANRKLHRSLHASHTTIPAWRQWRRPA